VAGTQEKRFVGTERLTNQHKFQASASGIGRNFGNIVLSGAREFLLNVPCRRKKANLP